MESKLSHSATSRILVERDRVHAYSLSFYYTLKGEEKYEQFIK